MSKGASETLVSKGYQSFHSIKIESERLLCFSNESAEDLRLLGMVEISDTGIKQRKSATPNIFNPKSLSKQVGDSRIFSNYIEDRETELRACYLRNPHIERDLLPHTHLLGSTIPSSRPSLPSSLLWLLEGQAEMESAERRSNYGAFHLSGRFSRSLVSIISIAIEGNRAGFTL